MATANHPPSSPAVIVEGARVLIVEARFYHDIADDLLAGARAALAAAGAEVTVLSVPGALEIAQTIIIAREAAEDEGQPYDAVVALGCIIRGETYHFDIVANESARALTDIGIAFTLPIGNGILTVEDKAQALARARPGEGDKGGDAARAALAVLAIKRRLAGAS